jgi:hypothetical protein
VVRTLGSGKRIDPPGLAGPPGGLRDNYRDRRRPWYDSAMRSPSPYKNCYLMQRPLTQRNPAAHRAAWRLAAVRTQTPLTRCIPAPHASRTVVTRFSGCWTGARGTACADDARVNADATRIILNIFSSYLCNALFFCLQAHYPPRRRPDRVGLKANFFDVSEKLGQ